jgi:hypothetical protein
MVIEGTGKTSQRREEDLEKGRERSAEERRGCAEVM